MDAVLSRALADARAFAAGGMDGLLVENFGDAPFFAERVPAETIAAMTRLTSAVVASTALPVGVNVLRNDARAALAVAVASGARFIRVNVHAGAAWSDQGLLTGHAAETLRLRRHLSADVAIFADVRVKHAMPVGERSLALEAEDLVRRAGADVLIVTGRATGVTAALTDLRELSAAPAPVLAGSGVDPANVRAILACCDGAIVGTALKERGEITGAVDLARVRAFVEAAREG
jgi:membrane complex biogenesis BtpA family protein